MFEINLNGQALEQLPNLKEVRNIGSIFLFIYLVIVCKCIINLLFSAFNDLCVVSKIENS